MAAKTKHFQAKLPQNQKKPVDQGLCEYKNCRQPQQMLDGYCGSHSVFIAGLADEVVVGRLSLWLSIRRFFGGGR